MAVTQTWVDNTNAKSAADAGTPFTLRVIQGGASKKLGSASLSAIILGELTDDDVIGALGFTPIAGIVGADVTAALGYAPLNAASYTAADVLSKLLTVDGAASGLDADLLDGQQGSYYRDASNLNAGSIASARFGDNTIVAARLSATAACIFGATGAGAAIQLSAAQATAYLNAVVGDSGAGGTKGLVPAPAAGDAAAAKFLKADGTWATPSGGGGGDTIAPATHAANSFARWNGSPNSKTLIERSAAQMRADLDLEPGTDFYSIAAADAAIATAISNLRDGVAAGFDTLAELASGKQDLNSKLTAFAAQTAITGTFTASTSDPSGGSNGDVHFKHEA